MSRPDGRAKEMAARSTWHEDGTFRASSLDSLRRGRLLDSSSSWTKGRFAAGRDPFLKGIATATHWYKDEAPARERSRDWDGVLPILAGRELSLPPDTAGEVTVPEVPAPPSFIPLARSLVEHCGSLARAFNYFDPQHTGKVTRTRWDQSLSTLHIDVQELCGAPSKQVFKMIDSIRGRGKGEVQLEEWNLFFQRHLEGTDAANLLSEDRGDPRAERRPSRRHSHFMRREELPGLPSEKEAAQAASAASASTSRANSKDFVERKSQHQAPEIPGPGAAPGAPPETEKQLLVAQARRRQAQEAETQEGPKEVSRKVAEEMAESEQVVSTESQEATTETQEVTETGEVLEQETEEAEAAPRDLEASREPDVQEPSQPESQELELLAAAQAQVDSEEPQAKSKEVQVDVKLQEMRGGEESLLKFEEDRQSRMGSKETSASKEPRAASKESSTEQSEVLLWAEENALLDQSPPPPDPALVSLELRRVLSGEAGVEDVQLSDEEFHHVALHEELHADLQHLELEGIAALGYVFIAKFGSLKRTFRWFDSNRQGRFGQVAWDNGLTLLHIDVERLTGYKGGQIFHMMDVEPQGGSVSLKKWNRFFAAVEEGALAASLQRQVEEKGSFAQRARTRTAHLKMHVEKARREEDRARKKNLRRGSAMRRGSSGVKRGSTGVEEQRHDEQEEAFRQKALDELEVLMKGDAMTYMNDCFKKWHAPDPESTERFDALYPVEKCEIVEEIADELGLWRLPREDTQKAAQAQASYGRSATMALLQPPTAGAAVLVCHHKAFAESTNAQLCQLQGTNGSLEFPASLSEIQRVVVHALAASKGLTTLSEGSGAERRLVAYDTGDFARELRKTLSDVHPGQSKILAETPSSAQRRLVHTMAMEMGLDVKNRGTGYEVFNLKKFRDGLQDELQKIGKGEVHEFDPSLTEQERAVVHDFALRLGLTAHTEGGRLTRQVCVANFKDFLANARARLEALLEPDSFTEFGALGKMEVVALEALATELGMHSARRSSERGLGLVVSNAEIPPQEQRRPSKTEDVAKDTMKVQEENWDEGRVVISRDSSQASLIQRVFEMYATGHYRGQRTFLRFSDLKDFAEDIKELMPDVHKTFHHFTGLLEFYYDDTQQLQSDMGDHGAKGLTLRYFQVFVQKVLRRLGPTIVGLLFAIIDGRQ